MGIHVPRILDAVESMVERSGFHDASLRAPAPFDVGPDGVRYTLAASDVSRYFHNMANSVGPSEVILRDGSALRISPSTAELEGE
jgi:hypothetical protein